MSKWEAFLLLKRPKNNFRIFLELPQNEQNRLDNMNKFIRKRCETIEEEVENGENPLDELDQAMDDNSEIFEEAPPDYYEVEKDRFDSSFASPHDLYNPATSEGYATHLRDLFDENFAPLIKELKQDIINLDSKSESKETILMAKVFAKRFLIQDNVDTRVAAVSHMFLKKFGITDPVFVSGIFIVCMLRNIGLTKVGRDILKRRDTKDPSFEQHSTMSKEILESTSVDILTPISVLCEESHAIGGGFGFPYVRNPESMDPTETAFFFASFLVESCYSFPKTKIDNIKTKFQEFQGNPEKARKTFGECIVELFTKDIKEISTDSFSIEESSAA